MIESVNNRLKQTQTQHRRVKAAVLFQQTGQLCAGLGEHSERVHREQNPNMYVTKSKHVCLFCDDPPKTKNVEIYVYIIKVKQLVDIVHIVLRYFIPNRGTLQETTHFEASMYVIFANIWFIISW